MNSFSYLSKMAWIFMLITLVFISCSKDAAVKTEDAFQVRNVRYQLVSMPFSESYAAFSALDAEKQKAIWLDKIDQVLSLPNLEQTKRISIMELRQVLNSVSFNNPVERDNLLDQWVSNAQSVFHWDQLMALVLTFNDLSEEHISGDAVIAKNFVSYVIGVPNLDKKQTGEGEVGKTEEISAKCTCRWGMLCPDGCNTSAGCRPTGGCGAFYLQSCNGLCTPINPGPPMN